MTPRRPTGDRAGASLVAGRGYGAPGQSRVSGALFIFGICLLYLAALSFALLVVVKLLEWSLRLILWLLNEYAEPEAGGIVININIVLWTMTTSRPCGT